RIDADKLIDELIAKQEAAAKTEAKAKLQDSEKEEVIEEITIDDFFKSDLRVAEILECEKIKKSNKLLKLQLNDGSGKTRQIVSGIAKWYKPEDLVGKKAIIVTNLKPVKLCGEISEGMLLSGEKDGEVAVTFVDLPVGAKIC
ncbi:MAG: methionine--tRNA ligase subunit beta, partial [Eubacterium sp.]|nr:methionine--tRNA ligase subunit beta [Eubacterium sp.]